MRIDTPRPLAPKRIGDLADIDWLTVEFSDEDIKTARQVWRRTAPTRYRRLLDAETSTESSQS